MKDQALAVKKLVQEKEERNCAFSRTGDSGSASTSGVQNFLIEANGGLPAQGGVPRRVVEAA